MIEAIAKRKCVRSFADKKVEPEKIESILQAAMRAPSGMNGQPWEFIVVEDPSVLEELKGFSPGARALKTAPLAIIVLEKELLKRKVMGMSSMNAIDLGACTENLFLQAVEEGLGVSWMGVMESMQEKLRSILDFPKDRNVFAVLAVGYPAEGVDMTVEDRFDPSRIHYNHY